MRSQPERRPSSSERTNRGWWLRVSILRPDSAGEAGSDGLSRREPETDVGAIEIHGERLGHQRGRDGNALLGGHDRDRRVARRRVHSERLIAGNAAVFADEPTGLDEPQTLAPATWSEVTVGKIKRDHALPCLPPDRPLEQGAGPQGPTPHGQVRERRDHAPGRPDARRVQGGHVIRGNNRRLDRGVFALAKYPW